MTVDTEKYLDFVDGVTSEPSKDFAQLLKRVTELEVEDDCDVSHLLTAALGLTAESGEFTEVVKKIILQGKPYNEENVFHMKRELGDIMWYWVTACAALDLDPYEHLRVSFSMYSLSSGGNGSKLAGTAFSVILAALVKRFYHRPPKGDRSERYF